MNDKIILKILDKDGKVSWKTDTAWSLDDNREHAKVHNSSSLDTLINNLLYLSNNFLNDEGKHYYDGCKVGYDNVEPIDDSYDFTFLSNGLYLYRLKYSDGVFSLVDISRKSKLEELNKIIN